MEGAPQKCQKDDIQVYTQHLDKHVFGTTEEKLPPGAVCAHDSVASKLSAWNAARSSQLLWLSGPHDFGFPSAMAIAATSTISSAIELKVPYVAFYCKRLNVSTEI